MTSVGEWLLSTGLLTSVQLQQLRRSDADDLDLAAQAVERGWVTPGQVFWVLNRVPSTAWPALRGEGVVAPEVPPEFTSRWGLIPWDGSGGTLVWGSFRWVPAHYRTALAWLMDRPVRWVLLPADLWRIRGRAHFSVWSRWEAEGFRVDVLGPWTLQTSSGLGGPWHFQVRESVHHRRPFFTIHQVGSEAWVDYHTPERAVRVLESASWEQIWQDVVVSQEWMDLAFFPARAGLWWVELQRRRLAWLFRWDREAGHRLCRVRWVDPARWQGSLEGGPGQGGLWDALRRWAAQESTGVWLLVGPADVLKAWWTVAWTQALSEVTPFPWVGVHDRWGRWDGLVEVVPTEAFPWWLERHMDTACGIWAEWNGIPQMFQALLLASSQRPVLVSVAYPTPAHALHRLWHMGFASAIRAGRIRGWLAVVTPRVQCGWCAEPYRPRDLPPGLRESAGVELSAGEVGVASRGCSVCQFIAPWQNADALYEWAVLPPEALRTLQTFRDLVALFPSVRGPGLAGQVLEGIRAGRLDARWGLRFLATLGTWPASESE